MDKISDVLVHWVWALPVLLCVAILSVRQIDLYAPEVDEFYSMYNTGMIINSPYSPIDVLQSLERNSANHTPLYFILLNMWGHLVGYEVALARVLTIFSGLLSLAMIYRLARDFVAPIAGHLALLVVVSNAFYNFYIPHARMYPLLVLNAALVLWLYLRSARQGNTIKTSDYLALFVACYALANTHVFSALLFIALGLYHLLNIGKDRRWLYVSLAVAAALLLFSPWLTVLIAEGIGRSFAYWSTGAADLGEIFGAWYAVTFNGSVLLLLVSIVGWILGLRSKVFSLGAYHFIALYFLIALGLVAQFTDALGLSRMRLALAGWPTVVLFIVSGLYGLYRWRKWLGLLVLVWALAGIAFQLSADWRALFAGRELPFQQPPWHVISRLAQRSDAQAPIIGYLYDPVFLNWPAHINYPQSEYYYASRGLNFEAFRDQQSFNDYVRGSAITESTLRVFYQTSSVEAADVAALEAIMDATNYRACDLRNVGVDTVLTLYGWQTLDCREPRLMATLSTDLIEYAFFGARVNAAGDKVLFVDRWTAVNAFSAEKYNLSHQLITGGWERGAHLDLPLVHEDSLRQFSIDISDAPAGSYRLMGILYDNQTNERFNWIDNPGDVPYMQLLAEVVIPET